MHMIFVDHSETGRSLSSRKLCVSPA
jgi:hypothetical protein